MASKSMCSSSATSTTSSSLDVIATVNNHGRTKNKRLKRLFDFSSIFNWNRSQLESSKKLSSSSKNKKRRNLEQYDDEKQQQCVVRSFVPTTANVSLEAPVLLQVLQTLPLIDRLRFTGLSRLSNFLYTQTDICLGAITIQRDDRDRQYYQLQSDDIGLLAHYIAGASHIQLYQLFTTEHWISRNRIVGITLDQLKLVLCELVAHVDGVDTFELATQANDIIVDYLCEQIENIGHVNRRFSIRKLSLMSSDSTDSRPFARLIDLLSRRLQMVCIRRMQLTSSIDSVNFWQSIAKCHRLTAFQYEPKCVDRFSRTPMVAALCDKRKLKSLAITNIKNFDGTNLHQIIAHRRRLECLSIVCPHFHPWDYVHNSELHRSLGSLRFLIIQIRAYYNMESSRMRDCLLSIVRQLPIDAYLEVIHETSDHVLAASTAIYQWLDICSVTDRCVKLKLDSVSQRTLDQSIGRLFRKSPAVQRVTTDMRTNVIVLKMTPVRCGNTSSGGKLVVLDQCTWFGDEHDIDV